MMVALLCQTVFASGGHILHGTELGAQVSLLYCIPFVGMLLSLSLIHILDVFYHYAGNLFFQLHIGEIPEAPYAVSGQEVHCFLRYAAGDGEHGHIGFALYHICLLYTSREFYDLERLWSDAEEIDISGIVTQD